MTIILFSLSFSVLIFFWLHTNVIIEYYNLFNFKGLKWLDDYNKKNKSGYYCSFPEFILKEYNSFYSRLLTCPICLSFWGGVFSIFWVGWSFLSVSFCILFFYYLLINLQKYSN